jgi:hypothetical protein
MDVMSDTIDPKLLDKRTASRFLKKGMLAEKDYERFLKSLPDLADKAESVEATIEPTHVGESTSDEAE